MRSICFYSSYFNQPVIPYYIKFYLENLLPYFSEIVFVTNEKSLDEASLDFLKQKNIRLMYVQNEGWDFGMWYKALKQTDAKSYDRIGLINDSCVLFTTPAPFFDWLTITDLDYCGMVDSNAVAYHVQSYFIVINKKAIAPVVDYFNLHGIGKDLNEVIQTYEIGLSRHLIKNGLKVGALYSTKIYKGEFSPMFYMPEQLIKNGLPLIKKKIIFCSFREDERLNLMRMNYKMDPKKYVDVIVEKYNHGADLIDFKRVVPTRNGKFYFMLFKYAISSFIFQIIRKFKFLKPA